MADIFGDIPADNGAEDVLAQDPAAEFLAQQEDEIAGLENDVLGTVEDVVPETNGFEELTEEVATPIGQDIFGDAEVIAEVEDVSNGLEEEDIAAETMDPSQAYAAIAAADARIDQLRGEPEKIRLWREESNKRLAEKDTEAEEQKEQWLMQAKKELEDWDKNRKEQLEKTRESNRLANEDFMKQLADSTIGYTAAEEEFVKERDENTPGSEWGRVSKLCDFNPKASKVGNKDVSRMRSSLLHLKQNPRPVQVKLGAQQ